MHLLIVDTTGIQPYIFGSNRLRENIGASQLVAQATEAWAFGALPNPNNLNADDKRIEEPSYHLAAEVLYAGGGNFVVLFQTVEGAKAFTRALSHKALEDAPNLQLVIAQQEFDWDNSVLSKAVDNLFKQLAKKKRSRPLSAPLMGLGVTVMCQSTGLPAVDVTEGIREDEGYPASAEILVKLDATKAANGRLRTMFDAALGSDYVFPLDFDELGRSEGEHSYIAVVHADGNGMGDRIQRIGKMSKNNRDYITRLRAFSQAVKEAAQSALDATLERLVTRLKKDGGSQLLHKNAAGKALAEIKLKPAGGGRYFLPCRPIVFGGDDVTFVCDGRLGLSFAVEYLRRFENETEITKRPDCNGRITACAGIAIVKTHYPFARAYMLAEELCKSAKTYRRKVSESNVEWNGSCLDWHFALSGLSGKIDKIREREYTVSAGSLTLRPVPLDKNPKESQREWNVVRNGITIFQGETWAGRRNKVKSLRETLREGPAAVEWFLKRFGIEGTLPVIQGYTNFAKTGWWTKWCGYFDAIEVADWFIPLEGGEGHEVPTSSET
jgi:Cas10/Cmr2, second palm domain